jgi:hypothetical protein
MGFPVGQFRGLKCHHRHCYGAIPFSHQGRRGEGYSRNERTAFSLAVSSISIQHAMRDKIGLSSNHSQMQRNSLSDTKETQPQEIPILANGSFSRPRIVEYCRLDLDHIDPGRWNESY